MKIQDFIVIDGKSLPIVRDATPEEEERWEQEKQSMPEPELSPEERITELEEQLAAAKILLGVE